MQKALKTANSEEFVFCVRRQVGCLSLKFRSFSVESKQTLTLLRIQLSARKTGEFHPAEVVTVCHLLGRKPERTSSLASLSQ